MNMSTGNGNCELRAWLVMVTPLLSSLGRDIHTMTIGHCDLYTFTQYRVDICILLNQMKPIQ